MNVLFVCVQLPFPPRSGVNMRVYQLLRQVAARHRVTLLSYAAAEEADRVAALREQVVVEVVQREDRSVLRKRMAQLGSLASSTPFSASDVHSAEMQRTVLEVCARHRIDIVQIEGALLGWLGIPPGIKVVLDEHNIEYEVFQRLCDGERSPARRWFNRREFHRFRRFEQECWRRADGCAVTSERERPLVRQAAPDLVCAVVPNGVDVDAFRPGEVPPVARTLVFNGILDYRPNLDAALYLVEAIWPRVLDRCPDARLEIVGRAQTADVRRLRRRGVTLTGEVADVRPHLQRAAVVAVPVRMGGGTRLKVLEGMAMGKAIVSTSLGCEGIAAAHDEQLLIGDDADAFARMVVELFEDRARCQALGAAARRLAEDRYAWDLAGNRLEDLYASVVGSPGIVSRRASVEATI